MRMGDQSWCWTQVWVENDDGTFTREWRYVVPTITRQIMNSVVYCYPSEKLAEQGGRGGGSGFLVGVVSNAQKALYLYVVTNEHVAVDCPWVRVTDNTKDRPVVRQVDRWHVSNDFHEPDDLAIWHFTTVDLGSRQYDSIYFHTLADSIQDRYQVGEDTYMIGRFVLADGGPVNQPTARFGNISRLPGEPIICGNNRRAPVFLVETRSQAGYSGSPVFVYRQKTKVKVPIDTGNYKRSIREITIEAEDWYEVQLLGVDTGHIEGTIKIEGMIVEGDFTSGLLGVVPAWSLKRLLLQPPIRDEREAPTTEAVLVPEAETDENTVENTNQFLTKLVQPGVKEEADEIHRSHDQS